MKHLPWIFLILLLAFVSCKTTEDNYRQAYLAAREKADEGLTDEELLGLRAEQSARRAVYHGDSIALRSLHLTLAEGEREGGVGASLAGRYCLVVASFRQIFNARSVRGRLAEAGFTDAFILQDSEPRYYVAVESSSSIDSILPLYKALDAGKAPANFPIAVKAPYPYILRIP